MLPNDATDALIVVPDSALVGVLPGTFGIALDEKGTFEDVLAEKLHSGLSDPPTMPTID